MWRINSPVAGMKAPCLFSGAAAKSGSPPRQVNYSLFNRRADLAKGSAVRTRISFASGAWKNHEPLRTRRITKVLGTVFFFVGLLVLSG
jgi:hypothetical protein